VHMVQGGTVKLIGIRTQNVVLWNVHVNLKTIRILFLKIPLVKLGTTFSNV